MTCFSRLANWSLRYRSVAIAIAFFGASTCNGVGIAMAQLEGAPAAALTSEQTQFFESRIRPVLVEHCYRCHSVDGQSVRGGLSLDHRDALLAGGESGPAVVPGNIEESVLWDAINYRGIKMPPNQKLPDSAIRDFRTWIEMGAPDPRVRTGVIIHSKVSKEDIQNGKSFWSFQPPKKSALPLKNNRSEWAQTEIDRWIEKEWEERGLSPAEDAAPYQLLRRLFNDLVGLQPTLEEHAAFEKEYAKSPERAIADTVDDLLGRPQFGERWGRHWLDVVRYAESTGKEVDATFPEAWRYRDFVIDSLNRDKPYDQFIRQQIAGDLLPIHSDEEWQENLIATTFLAIGPKSLSEQNPRQFRADLIDDQIDATTRVVLGLSVACARCHDHKFDPIPQSDYYAMAGIFQSTETSFGGNRSLRNRQPSQLLALPIPDRKQSLQPIPPEEIGKWKEELKQLQTKLVEARRAQRQTTTDSNIRPNPLLNAALIDQVISQVKNQIDSYDEQGKPLSLCMGVQDSSRITNAKLLERGEVDRPAQEIARGFISVLSNEEYVLPKNHSGRKELAAWLTSRNNPLTARVMVNRIWQHMIGKPIVRETDNFGMSGPAPTHPELLDHLAVEFMDQNWSVKKLIQQIALSRTYRLASTWNSQHFDADPNNFYIARGNVRRLDAEAFRDSLLQVTKQMDWERPYGSIISGWGQTIVSPNGPATIPKELVAALASDGKNSDGSYGRELFRRIGTRFNSKNPLDATVYYRSVYLPIARNQLPRALDLFDFAEPSLIVGEREVSNTPEQALYMLNSEFVREQSDALSKRLIREASNNSERIAKAFESIYGRVATQEEVQAAHRFFRTAFQSSSRKSDDSKSVHALSQLCQALLASAEFRYIP